MTKSAVVKNLMKKLDLKKSTAGEAYNLIIECIADSLKNGVPIRLHKLGTLHVIQCKEKKYNNPQTHCIETLGPMKRVKFKSSKNLHEMVNSNK